ncbi:MRC1-like domain-containing protein [Biscogniauxia marginata]|nr:MRC1-like domain-containing protein [Biscogniauxia marginata]
MASTRASSPAEGVSAPTSPQLTPRSKIRALLEAVDNQDSDDEVAGPIDTKTLFKSIEKNRETNDPAPPTQNSDDDDDKEEEEEEEIVRPRGRIAARMHSNYAKGTDTSKSSGNLSIRTTSEHSNQGKEDTARTDDEDEDGDIHTQPRRRLARKARSATPEAAPEANSPSSPGLFVSPSPQKTVAPRRSAAGSDTDEELPADLSKSERFNALVARKRQERLEKEAAEERKREERAQRMADQMPADSGADDDDDDVSDITDDDGGRKLTQEVSRPSRKASKKALEEMNRETQRLSRSLQLAHEVKTKKKITKASLFERFNFKTKDASKEGKLPSSSRPTTPGSNHQTDVEMGDSGTPPSSPPNVLKTISSPPAVSGAIPSVEDQISNIAEEDENEDLSDLVAAMVHSKAQDKGKGKEPESASNPTEAKKPDVTKPKRQVRVKLPPVQANLISIDSDDELEVTNSKRGRLDSVFDRLPEQKDQESRSLNVLRRLAQLSSPPKGSSRNRNVKSSMTPGELQMTLQQRARAQAKLERERRLEFLRSKGVVVQTAEEREREREQVEDIVARARQEAEELMQKEREDAKKARKERKENGETDPLAWDDSDDDSFGGNAEDEPSEIEFSGSEEEDEENVEESGEEADEEDKSTANPMLVEEAEEDDETEEEQTPTADIDSITDDEVNPLPAIKSRRQKKHTHIVSDDEDDEVQATPKPRTTHPRSPSAPGSGSPKAPTSVLRSATKPFIPGLPVPASGPAGLGLTQIFAGTMDDSQAGSPGASPQEFMPSLDQFPGSQFSATVGQSQNNDMVLDSQPTQGANTLARDTQTQGVQLHFSQSQVHGFDSFMQMDSTQMSEFIEPTQDGGFQDFSPLKQRFIDAPQSTVDTVLLEGTPDHENVQDSPLVRKRGKLRRRGQASLSISSLPPTDIPTSPSATRVAAGPAEVESANTSTSAFRLMEKAARRKKRMQEKFDKKKSKANEMIEEQAEESEDEYAGLGGADGEDSSEEDEELVKEMIDDAAGNDIDEAKLAGFFADRERAADAAQVDKLFRDITTGMLRKRRRGGGGNNDIDLSDSDDGGEARRRMKRRQFAKMQKALLADERIGKIAENPRNAAFLKSIEDRNSDDEWDFGDNFAESAPPRAGSESEPQDQGSEGQHEAIPDSQPTNLSRKRTRTDDHAGRPAPNARRTKEGTRPTSLSEVRRSVSSLLEEPDASIIPATEVGSDSEEERPSTSASSDKENRYSRTATATAGRDTKNVAVVDRISLKRNNSSSRGTTTTSRLAFAAPSVSGPGGFKVPALLRRATTNSLISNSSSSSSSAPGTSNGGGGQASSGAGAGGNLTIRDDGGKLKKNAGKRSGVNYFARENERRAKVAEAERRREEKKWKGAEGRGKVVGGLFGGGSFE